MNEETGRDLEQELRASLKREAAPPDFAAKLMAKVGAPLPFPKPKPQSWLRRPLTLALAATLAAMAIIPTVVVDHERRERARGLRAKQDLLTALAITRDQLQHAREKVRHTASIIQ